MDWAWLDIGISAERERARRDLYGNSIAFVIKISIALTLRSVDLS